MLPRAELSLESDWPTRVLHDEVKLALLGLADVVDVDDVRVVDAIGRARLAQHPRAEVGLAAQVRPDQLDGDDAVDEHVPRPVDHTHTAFADSRFESVTAGDDAAEHRIRRLGRLGNSLCHGLSAPLEAPAPALELPIVSGASEGGGNVQNET